jgi:hypothetical protein
MAQMEPKALANMIMGKLYNVLTSGDETVPKSDDNFFTWCTPGMPVDPSDFNFLTQGLTGTVKREDIDVLRGPAAAKPTEGGDKKPAEGGDKPAEGGEPKSGGLMEISSADLDKMRAGDTVRMYMQAESLARICDFVPDVSKVQNEQFAKFNVANNEGSLSSVYDLVLRMSQVMESKLPDATVKKIERLRGLLQVKKQKKNLVDETVTEVTEPSPMVQAYNEKMAAYDNAALEYNTHRIDALTAATPRAVHFWSINEKILRNKVRAAMTDWIANGYKNDYEQIGAYLDQVQARDMTLLKARYKDDFDKAKLNGVSSGSDFYFTSLAPASFARAGGWTEFGFSESEVSSSQKASTSSTSVGGHGSAGFMGFGASASHSESKARQEFHGKIDSKNFNLKFMMCQVVIQRPWLHAPFFRSKTWRFDEGNPDTKGQMLNDGGKPPKGLLPAYPTAMILVRDLELRMSKSKALSDFVAEQKSKATKAGGSVAFGPFSIGGGGSYSSASGNSDKKWESKFDGETMRVPGMQIIGFKCHVLPKSPMPDPKIKEWV